MPTVGTETVLLVGFVAYLILDLSPYGQQQVLPWRTTITPPSIAPPAEAPGPVEENAG